MTIPIGILAQGRVATGLGWLSVADGSPGANDYTYDSSLDSSQNSYAVIDINGFDTSKNQTAILIKHNSLGTIQWQREMYNPTTANGITSTYVDTDSSGNSHVAFFDEQYDATTLYKYNSSGVAQWARYIGPSQVSPKKVRVDSSGNVFLLGQSNSTGTSKGVLVKYNSSGTLQWQRNLPDISRGLAISSTGDVYVSGASAGTTPDSISLVKINTSGTELWGRSIPTIADVYGFTTDVEVDSAGNVYLAASAALDSGNSSTNAAFLAKFNSSGTIQWQRTNGTTLSAQSIGVDTDGNSYWVGYYGSNLGTILKHNTNGTLVWARSFNGQIWSAKSKDNASYYSTINIGGPYRGMVLKLPSDGSLTGTYSVGGTSFSYGILNTTSNTSSYSVTNTSSNLSTASFTAGTATISERAATKNWNTLLI